MFILSLNYIKPLEVVEQFLPGHRQFLDTYYQQKKFLLSGPKEPRTGGVILCHCEDKEAVLNIISQDPFYINQIAEYDITEFYPVKTSEDLTQYLK